jgi:ankyrin repeat protein/catechol 2,3-dioxygenase-like lactoylglutathione lyase family enzyme
MTAPVLPAGHIRGLSACISVAELERSIPWYEQVLGFQQVKRADFPELDATAVFLQNGPLRLELVCSAGSANVDRLEPPRHNNVRGLSQLALYVDNVDEVLATLAAAGIDPVLPPISVESLRLRSSFIRDPDGNLIELLEDESTRMEALIAARAELDRQLTAAVRAGDLPLVRQRLDAGARIDQREPATGLTPLMIASGLADDEMVRLLIGYGADVFAVDSAAGASVLHKACQGGSVEVVKQLVAAGAFVDAVAATTGHTPLMDALWFKFPSIVEYLLDAGAGLNLSTHYGFSLQEHFAYELAVNTIGKDQLLIAEQLLKDRLAADTAAAKSQRLLAAVVADDFEEVQRLLAADAAIDERAPRLNGFNDGHTALHVAARDGHTSIVTLLLAAGADVNAVEPVFGAVPLHKAVYNGHADITQLLLGAPGIVIDFQGATNGYTPLHDALWHGYEECARLLVEAGAQLELTGHDGKTPLDLASEVFGAEHPLTERIRTLLYRQRTI